MKIELAKTEVIHFVGIGGIGMSGLSLIMKGMGFNVQGSDIVSNKNIDRLKKNKIRFANTQSYGVDEVSDTAKETYNSISQESQDAAADFSNLGQDTAEFVRPNPRTPTEDPTASVTPQSPPSESTIAEPVDEQPSVSSSLLDEEDVDDDEPTTQTGDVPQPDEVP